MDSRRDHDNIKTIGFMEPRFLLTTIVIILMIRFIVKYCFSRKESIEVLSSEIYLDRIVCGGKWHFLMVS